MGIADPGPPSPRPAMRTPRGPPFSRLGPSFDPAFRSGTVLVTMPCHWRALTPLPGIRRDGPRFRSSAAEIHRGPAQGDASVPEGDLGLFAYMLLERHRK